MATKLTLSFHLRRQGATHIFCQHRGRSDDGHDTEDDHGDRNPDKDVDHAGEEILNLVPSHVDDDDYDSYVEEPTAAAASLC